MLDALQALDRALFLAINNGLHGPINDRLIGSWTVLGETGVLAVVLAVTIAWLGRDNLWRDLGYAVVTFIAAMLLVRLLKGAIDRPRPLSDLAALIASGAVSVHVLFEPLRQFSMPSGHATLAFASATALARLHRRYAALFLGAAGLVALSRIYVGAHFPSDVVVGALLGTAVALGTHQLWYGRRKPVDTAPGPR